MATEADTTDPVLALAPQIAATVVRHNNAEEPCASCGALRAGDRALALFRANAVLEALRFEALSLTPTTLAGALLQLQLAVDLPERAMDGIDRDNQERAATSAEAAIRNAIRLIGPDLADPVHGYFVGREG